MPLRRQGIQQADGALFGLFWPLTVAQAHSWATTVLVDEFDAGGFQMYGTPASKVEGK
jgi:hypothetical protein